MEAFLDCLLESKIPGFVADDTVSIKSPHFLPEVSNPKDGVVQVTSFSNIGSGGKKTFFKCAFAVAVHLLAKNRGGVLPTFFIIDSPMKNLSERENKDQFLGFHQMLYTLAETDLLDTQIILIDSEMVAPPANNSRSFLSRHMTTDEASAPPLITYYRGK